MALCLLPGMPNIYYGDEIGLDGRMGSVEASRYPMQWDESKWNRGTLAVHRLMGRVRRDEDLAFASTYFLPLDEKALLIVRKTRDKAWLLVLNKGGKRDMDISCAVLEDFTVTECLYGECPTGRKLSRVVLECNQSLLLTLSR